MSQESTITQHVTRFFKMYNCNATKPAPEYESQEVAKVIHM